jgi:hypothetical protein
MRAGFIVSAAVGLMVVGSQSVQAQVVPAVQVEKAVGKSVTLLQSSAQVFEARMGKLCFSCHHQSVPSLAYANLAATGRAMGARGRAQQSDFVYGFAAKLKPLLVGAVRGKDQAAAAQIDKITVDPPVTLGYLLFGLERDGRKSDEALSLAAQFLARKQEADGRWPVYAARPPMEGSELSATAIAVRSLKAYGAAEFESENQERIARARDWMTATRPRSTEDRAFRLLGLRWSGADPVEIAKATRELLDDQRDDGGWSQLPGKGSDAYATGQVLFALHEGGGLPVANPAYSRGSVYLLLTQQPDGSWRVAKRAHAAQPHFESGFPHGKDQFISVTGTAWATAALALTLPEAQSAAKR